MNFVNLYHDITKEIEIYELRLDDLEAELKEARKLCFTGQLPSTPLPVHVPLDKALDQYDVVTAKILEVSERLAQKRLVRQRIEDNISDFQGIEYQVAYLRDIRGLPLSRIADELGYSYNWIMKVSSRIKKAERRQKKVANP